MDATALADEARTWARSAPMLGTSVTRELDRGILLARKLADALETLQTDLDARFEHSDHQAAKYYQRMRAAEREMHARELHHFEEEQKSAGLAAEVERLRLVHAGQSRLALSAVFMAGVDDDDGVQAFYREWVRNHDAALIESLADEAEAERERISESTPDLFTGLGRERSQKLEEQRELQRRTSWLRERARQVREGEA